MNNQGGNNEEEPRVDAANGVMLLESLDDYVRRYGIRPANGKLNPLPCPYAISFSVHLPILLQSN